MSLWKIAWRSIQQRALSSTLTGISMALGVALVIAVLVIYGVIRTQFMQGAQGYDLIIGAKGGKLQLVLNTVYHLSQPIENIPYSLYKDFDQGEYAPFVAAAIPYCLGDSYLAGGETFRVVGTTRELFEKIEYGRNPDGSPKRYRFEAGGRNFESDHFFEAVIGSVVARRAGLKVGDSFQPSHGIIEEGVDAHQHEAFKIVGILEPTGTPNDRAMFVNIEGFYLLEDHAKPLPKTETEHDHEHAEHAHEHKDKDGHKHEEHEEHKDGDHAAEHDHGEHAKEHKHEDGHTHEEHEEGAPAAKHDHEHEAEHEHEHAAHHDHGHDHDHHHEHHHHEPLPESQREVTAILLHCNNALYSQDIFQTINEGQLAQAVYPTQEITVLFERIVGPMQLILLVLTVLIVVVAGVGIMVSIYNSMSDRRHEIAVMRALGAGRTTVMSVVLWESILLALAGGAAGVILGHGAIGLVSPFVVERTGVAIHFLEFNWQELLLIPCLVALAALVGFLPALAAYRTDVAKSLTSNP